MTDYRRLDSLTPERQQELFEKPTSMPGERGGYGPGAEYGPSGSMHDLMVQDADYRRQIALDTAKQLAEYEDQLNTPDFTFSLGGKEMPIVSKRKQGLLGQLAGLTQADALMRQSAAPNQGEIDYMGALSGLANQMQGYRYGAPSTSGSQMTTTTPSNLSLLAALAMMGGQQGFGWWGGGGA